MLLETVRSIMLEMSGIELSRFYPELTSFGTNTLIWRKCWEILGVSPIFIVYNLWLKMIGAILAILLPFINVCWKRTKTNKIVCNHTGARQVFERWMEWEPEEQAWHSYINFELRYKELDRARHIYERFVMVHPEVKHNLPCFVLDKFIVSNIWDQIEVNLKPRSPHSKLWNYSLCSEV